MALNQAHDNLLRAEFSNLVKCCDHTQLSVPLLTKGAIDWLDQEVILAEKTRRDGMLKLLDIYRRKNTNLDKLAQALRDCGWPEIAVCLST